MNKKLCLGRCAALLAIVLFLPFKSYSISTNGDCYTERSCKWGSCWYVATYCTPGGVCQQYRFKGKGGGSNGVQENGPQPIPVTSGCPMPILLTADSCFSWAKCVRGGSSSGLLESTAGPEVQLNADQINQVKENGSLILTPEQVLNLGEELMSQGKLEDK